TEIEFIHLRLIEDVVVGRGFARGCGEGWQWIEVGEELPRSTDKAAGDLVTGELKAGGGIDDGGGDAGEITLHHFGCGNGGNSRDLLGGARTFIAGEIEGAVLQDRTAQCAAELILLKRWNGAAGRREVVLGVRNLITQEF